MRITDHIKFIFSKNFLLFSLSVVVFLLLRIPIEHFISNTIIKFALSYINEIWYNDILFLIILLYIILLTVHKFRRYTPSLYLTVFIIGLTAIYLIYRTRIVDVPWTFTSFSILTHVKYADILIAICLCQCLLLVPNKKAGQQKGKNSFFDDQALKSEGADQLGYNSYAALLGSKIISSHFDKSFAIGINGKWGIGKTSFINLLKSKVKAEDIIEINFNPWNSHSPQAIIKDFFETVQESIRPYHSSLSRLLIQYSHKLVTLNSNTVTQSIQTTVAAVTGFDSINSVYREINEALVSIKKKLVIYIDDLDRLDNNEIIEVLRLIRNTANFHNTFFIVAYDRNYIINALKQQNSYKHEEFLEKIFQIEITLPYFNKDILRYKLAEKLKEQLPERLHITIDKDTIGTAASKPEFLNEWLESMRDVTRLANALTLNSSKLEGEVVFNDFMRVELLRLNYPSAYELLFRKTFEFLEISSHPSNDNHYQLKNIEDNDLSGEERGMETLFGLYLFRNHIELSIPKNEVSKIVDFVNGIFGRRYSVRSRPHLSIIHPSKFNRYFAYNLLEGSLSEIEFSKARAQDQDVFNAKITEWVNKGLEFELRNRFTEIKDFDNREDFEKVIKAIFHLANQPAMNPYYDSINLVYYDSKDLYDKLSNYENKLISQYYSGVDGKEELKNFIKGLFESAKSPYIFEADLLHYLNDQPSNSFPLNHEELKEISITYLKKYCSEVKHLDSNVWDLFRKCKQTEWLGIKQETMPKEAKEIMKDFILNKDIDGFLIEIIVPEPFEKKKFALSEGIDELIFENWQNFEDELAQIDEEESKYINEFKAFLAEFASKNYFKYVDFNFEVIPIHKKLRTA